MHYQDKDVAVVFKIHLGLTRSGDVFMDGDTLENVLGDIPHRQCLETIARTAQVFLEKMVTQHFGESVTSREALNVTADDLVSFFDAHNTINND